MYGSSTDPLRSCPKVKQVMHTVDTLHANPRGGKSAVANKNNRAYIYGAFVDKWISGLVRLCVCLGGRKIGSCEKCN